MNFGNMVITMNRLAQSHRLCAAGGKKLCRKEN